MAQICSCILDAETCVFEGTVGKVVVDEGTNLGSVLGVSLDDCKNKCDSTSLCDRCHSLAYCPEGTPPGCYLKDEKLKGSEPTHEHHGCTTYYRKCSGNHIKRLFLKFCFVNLSK